MISSGAKRETHPNNGNKRRRSSATSQVLRSRSQEGESCQDCVRPILASSVGEATSFYSSSKVACGSSTGRKARTRSTLGGGRRASTLRDRVRAAKKFLAWLAISQGISYTSQRSHLTDYLAARRSEPCTRTSLKRAYHGQAFLKEIAGVKIEDRITSAPMYTTMYKELLPKALQGKVAHQAPRMYTSMLLSSQVLATVRVFFFTGYTLGGLWCSLGEY